MKRKKDTIFVKDNKKIEYAQIPASLDIETSSFINENGDKNAIMYLGAFDINHAVMYFRDWEDYILLFNMITEIFELNENRRIIIYCHNLSYEFQWICTKTDFTKVFALEERKPVYAITGGIEYRCSYRLTNYSLKQLAKINKLPLQKLDEEYDYNIIRSPITKLEKNAYKYLYNDVEIVVFFIEKIMKNEVNISYIPITKTAYVRRFTKEKCLDDKYRKMMKRMKINPIEYRYLKYAFTGGFTHANLFNVGKVHNNVSSFDFNSDYPARMVTEYFPVGSGEIINNPTREEYIDSVKYYLCILDITMYDIKSKNIGDNIISLSKCLEKEKAVGDNGRIISADKIRIVCTNLDYNDYKKFYKFKHAKINTLIRYAKGYLPVNFIKSILQLYVNKTKLKGIEGREDEYMRSKEDLNSEYGMCVTDIIRPVIEYDNDFGWSETKPNLDEEIEKYNKKRTRFLFYPWGVWVTSYARHYLYEGIYNTRLDYIYSDTDSLKITNKEKYAKFFFRANDSMKRRIRRSSEYNKIPYEYFSPETNKGIKKYIGVWDYEETYKSFKTLGAKRYIYEDDKSIYHITIAGLNKRTALEYMIDYCKEHNISIYDFFDDEMTIPKGYAGRNDVQYIDDITQGYVKDYQGNIYKYYEESSIYMCETEYTLNISDMYIKLFLFGKAESEI